MAKSRGKNWKILGYAHMYPTGSKFKDPRYGAVPSGFFWGLEPPKTPKKVDDTEKRRKTFF